MLKFLTQIFGSRNQRVIKEFSRTVAAINEFEAQIATLADGEFPQKTKELMARHTAGAALTELIPEAFALVREASKRKLGVEKSCFKPWGAAVGRSAQRSTPQAVSRTASAVATP